MPAAIALRGDFSAVDLRASARQSQDTRQCRRLLALAAVAKGRGRAEAAEIGGMDVAPSFWTLHGSEAFRQ